MILWVTNQAALSYALPNEEPASHLNAHNSIYGSLKRRISYRVDIEHSFPPQEDMGLGTGFKGSKHCN